MKVESRENVQPLLFIILLVVLIILFALNYWLSWSIANKLSLATIFIGIIGGCFACYQWRQQVKLQRSQFVKQLIEKFRFDNDIFEVSYLIDYGKIQCNEDYFSTVDKELERRTDKYLSYLSYMYYLLSIRIITKDDFALFEYKLVRTLKSEFIQTYLWNLAHFAAQHDLRYTCHNLIEYGIKNKKLDSDFLTNKNKYEKWFNF